MQCNAVQVSTGSCIWQMIFPKPEAALLAAFTVHGVAEVGVEIEVVVPCASACLQRRTCHKTCIH